MTSTLMENIGENITMDVNNKQVKCPFDINHIQEQILNFIHTDIQYNLYARYTPTPRTQSNIHKLQHCINPFRTHICDFDKNGDSDNIAMHPVLYTTWMAIEKLHVRNDPVTYVKELIIDFVAKYDKLFNFITGADSWKCAAIIWYIAVLHEWLLSHKQVCMYTQELRILYTELEGQWSEHLINTIWNIYYHESDSIFEDGLIEVIYDHILMESRMNGSWGLAMQTILDEEKSDIPF